MGRTSGRPPSHVMSPTLGPRRRSAMRKKAYRKYLLSAAAWRSRYVVLAWQQPGLAAMSVSAATAGRPNNVPAHLPSMVGREEALETVRERLLQEGCGLLTLTGPGGSGKTRLALAVAGAVLDRPEFPDGVWVADLAPLNDPLLIPGAVAASIGVQEQPG